MEIFMKTSIIEINFVVDDMTGEQMGALFEVLQKSGAVDVSSTSIIMKKSRPGQSFTVLCEEEKFDAVTDAIFKHSTTFGFRYQKKERKVLEREIKTVKTQWGEVAVKIGKWKGEIVTVSPEYEDCLRLAQKNSVSLKAVMLEAQKNYEN